MKILEAERRHGGYQQPGEMLSNGLPGARRAVWLATGGYVMLLGAALMRSGWLKVSTVCGTIAMPGRVLLVALG
ncbi:hypothetical protein KCP69_12035 [Salmonella enterica subsp. enterica]|nr:hypothetical protein KCP69_12035 [Salmonella enterica subsp. enterica]